MPEAGRGVRVLVFGISITLAGNFPNLFAGGRIEGDHPRAPRGYQLHVEPVLIQKRRRVHAVLRLEAAVAILRVELPDFIALEIKASELPRADKDEDVFAVRAGRWGSAVPFVAANWPIRADRPFPQHLAVRAGSDDDQIVAVLTGQKDVLIPDGGRRAAHAGHLELPNNVRRFAPRRRQIRFVADAVVIGAAPLRPVFQCARGLSVGTADRGQVLAGRRAARALGVTSANHGLSRPAFGRPVAPRTTEAGSAAAGAPPLWCPARQPRAVPARVREARRPQAPRSRVRRGGRH